MSTVKIKQRLRPIRLAFLVDPSDEAILRRVIQMNSCMWGGRFNAIVPVFGNGAVPASLGSISSEEITANYLKLFEPDFVIDTRIQTVHVDEPWPDRLGIDNLTHGDGETFGLNVGLNVGNLFIDLYNEEFQFTRRQPIEAIYANNDDLFLNACYGSFPTDTAFSTLKSTYLQTFGAEEIDVNADLYANAVIFGQGLTVLRAGAIDLDAPRPGDFRRRVLLVDETSSADIMEFWNLRALGLRIIPIPLRWRETLAPLLVTRIKSHIKTVDIFNMGVYTVCGTASVNDNLYNDFLSLLSTAPQSSVCRFSMYRPPWFEKRDHISAEDIEETLDLKEDRFVFNTLTPKFAPKHVRVR